MNFTTNDIPLQRGTKKIIISGSSSSSSSGILSPQDYLLLKLSTDKIDNGIILKTTNEEGKFGDVTGLNAQYIKHSSTDNKEGWIWQLVDPDDLTSTNIASLNGSGVLNIKQINLVDGDKTIKLSINSDGTLHSDASIASDGDITAFGSDSGSGGGSGGGLIEQVFNYNNLGDIFLNSELTNTFNAYTINELAKQINSLNTDSLSLKAKDEALQTQINNGVSDKFFQYIQNMPSKIWTVNHSLNKYPSCTIIDSAGYTVEGEIKYIDSNNLTITFNSTFSGIVNLN